MKFFLPIITPNSFILSDGEKNVKEKVRNTFYADEKFKERFHFLMEIEP